MTTKFTQEHITRLGHMLYSAKIELQTMPEEFKRYAQVQVDILEKAMEVIKQEVENQSAPNPSDGT